MSNFFKNIHPLLRRSKKPNNYDDTNFAVLNALNHELTQAEQETIASKIQSSLESATDEYLDTWGDWFGVYRKDGWDDEYYRKRIIRELLLKRATIPAIIDALVDFLNDNDAIINIYEPWRNIFYLNKSKLNGYDHLMGHYYRFAIIDISIDRPFPPEIIEVIKAFKPAGVKFYINLDMSLNKDTTTIESPYADLDIITLEELEMFTGLFYDVIGDINLSNQIPQIVDNNLFRTNNSKLNGEDVLSGAFSHGRGFIHLASDMLLEEFIPTNEDTLSTVKTKLGEGSPDLYAYTAKADGVTAQLKVPKLGEDIGVSCSYITFDVMNYIELNYKEEYRELVDELGDDALSTLLGNLNLSTKIRALVSPANPLETEISIFDFTSNNWFSLKEVNVSKNFIINNSSINRPTEHLNSNGLLFIRIACKRKQVDTLFEIDSLNLLFNHRMGEGYSIGIQSSVDTFSELVPVGS
ncbi:baseplate wedge protein [Enterococcus phage 53]|uniref:baseplate wedge protein n=1 Tax=Enterococcus phage 53 TaxID=3028143 RepID=UPI004034347C|nr:baseplate wedge protein [Enterococcus phage 53]